jgi:hypothetical protein
MLFILASSKRTCYRYKKHLPHRGGVSWEHVLHDQHKPTPRTVAWRKRQQQQDVGVAEEREREGGREREGATLTAFEVPVQVMRVDAVAGTGSATFSTGCWLLYTADRM